LVQDRDGAEFKTGGILLYVEDFKRGSNKDIGPKDIFEMGSSKSPSPSFSDDNTLLQNLILKVNQAKVLFFS